MHRSKLSILGVVLAASALVAGCGKVIKKDSLEGGIKSAFEKAGLKLKSAECPADRPVKAGDVFDCTGELDEGGKVTVNVTQKNDTGHVSFDIVGFVFTEATVNELLTKAAGSKVEAKCTKKVAVLRKGESVSCEYKIGENTDKIEYTAADDEKSLKAKVTRNGAEAAAAPAPVLADTPPVEADEPAQ
jgi:hypothetical protein